ncbi:MAG: iron ABC transporter permease [Myxococcales bacterium]|nr:iron ABC transporter permease [Myxococcales bacterium]
MRGPWALVGAIALLLIAMAAGAAIGSVDVPLADVLTVIFGGPQAGTDATTAAIVWSVRLPRLCLGALVGASLSASGAALQGLFRNPLADPYVLGIAAGGALGAAATLLLALRGQAAVGAAPIGAFAGAALAAATVWSLARVADQLPLAGVLLAGVAVGLTCSAGVSLVLVLAETHAGDILRWLLGDLGGRGFTEVGLVALFAVPGLATLQLTARALDALQLGEDAARGLGVDARRTKLLVLGASALLVAGAVAFCGLIGFVGLIVPHAVRFFVGPGHRWLIPVAAVAGAATLVAADLGARVAMPDRALPVGVITGCLGGPFFLWLLRHRGLS